MIPDCLAVAMSKLEDGNVVTLVPGHRNGELCVHVRWLPLPRHPRALALLTHPSPIMRAAYLVYAAREARQVVASEGTII